MFCWCIQCTIDTMFDSGFLDSIIINLQILWYIGRNFWSAWHSETIIVWIKLTVICSFNRICCKFWTSAHLCPQNHRQGHQKKQSGNHSNHSKQHSQHFFLTICHFLKCQPPVQGLSKKTVSYMSKSIFSYTNRYVWGIRTSGLLLYRKHSQM